VYYLNKTYNADPQVLIHLECMYVKRKKTTYVLNRATPTANTRESSSGISMQAFFSAWLLKCQRVLTFCFFIDWLSTRPSWWLLACFCNYVF